MAKQFINLSPSDQVALSYPFVSPPVSFSTTDAADDTATVALQDGAVNVLSLPASVTGAVTFTLPAATGGKCRDFFVNVHVGAADAPSPVMFVDPATSATADVVFGADALADIAPGDNLVLFSEIAATEFLVSVKHEDAQ